MLQSTVRGYPNYFWRACAARGPNPYQGFWAPHKMADLMGANFFANRDPFLRVFLPQQRRILGGFGASAPGLLKGRKKKKTEKGKERERKREKKEGKKGIKNLEKDKSTWRLGRHSSTSRGAPAGLQGRKLEGRQIDIGGGGEGAILQLCSRAQKLITHWAPGLRPSGY